MLFNNNNKVEGYAKSCADNCFVCCNGLLVNSGEVVSSVNGIMYNVEKNLSCNNGGIQEINAGCNDQYSGKTVYFGNCGKEHFHTSKATAVYTQKWNRCNKTNDFTITFVENY